MTEIPAPHKLAIERIVARLPGAPEEVYSWLNRFRNPDGTPLHHYTEFKFSGTPLPADIMVVDDEVALQYFATYPDPGKFSFAICHYDPRVARRFREYLDALTHKRKLPASAAFMQELPRYWHL
jgi:hypothetical protein